MLEYSLNFDFQLSPDWSTFPNKKHAKVLAETSETQLFVGRFLSHLEIFARFVDFPVKLRALHLFKTALSVDRCQLRAVNFVFSGYLLKIC